MIPSRVQRTPPATDPAARPRRYLFLQGLAGPFFARLGRRLAAQGHGVHRVNFHGGDWLFWPRGGVSNYRGRSRDWPRYLARLTTAHRITDIVLFGDCRPLHRDAVRLAEARGITVHVFEEGYIRPDWVTMEKGGVNGHSTLPRNLEHYRDADLALPVPSHDLGTLPLVRSSFLRRAVEDVQYNVAAMVLRPFFPHYETHRPWHPAVEYAGWIKRLLTRHGPARRAAAALDRLATGATPYFLFPLQLDCDYQVRLHSPFKGLRPAIDLVLRSFAAHAPVDALLVVKAHPLDNGLTDWGRVVTTAASLVGLRDRVLFLDGGDLTALSAGSRGMVTINSTSGTLALAQGVPTIVLGQAVYDIPGITHAGPMDTFWRVPQPPLPGAFEAFRRVLVDRCLIRGGYFSEEGLAMLVENAAARLTRPDRPVRAPSDADTPVAVPESALVLSQP